jgi:hypothetical protein
MNAVNFPMVYPGHSSFGRSFTNLLVKDCWAIAILRLALIKAKLYSEIWLVIRTSQVQVTARLPDFHGARIRSHTDRAAFCVWSSQETGDRQNYQGRYVIRHPWKGEATCDVSQYQAELRERQEREAQQLANLTGWDIENIRNKIPFSDEIEPQIEPWWKRIWS